MISKEDLNGNSIDPFIDEAKNYSSEQISEFIKHCLSVESDDPVNVRKKILTACTLMGFYAAAKELGDISVQEATEVLWNLPLFALPYENERFNVIRYSDLLYPDRLKNYNILTQEIYEWTVTMAGTLLKQEDDRINTARDKGETVTPLPPEVTHHWQTLVKGYIPFWISVSPQRNTEGNVSEERTPA